jgi:hypothetical protein
MKHDLAIRALKMGIYTLRALRRLDGRHLRSSQARESGRVTELCNRGKSPDHPNTKA